MDKLVCLIMKNPVSLFSLTISICAIYFTIKTYVLNKRQAFQAVAKSLIDQKNIFLSTYTQVCDDLSMNDEIKDYILSELSSNYCNAYEYACDLYLNNGIDKKLFRSVFKDEIEAIVQNQGIASKMGKLISDEKSEVYNAIRTVAKEWNCEIQVEKEDPQA